MRISRGDVRSRFGSASGRGRLAVVALVVVALVVLLSARVVARAITDQLWFDGLGHSAVWRSLLGEQAVLGVGFGLSFFAFMYANLALTGRLAPPVQPLSGRDDFIDRYRESIRPRQRFVHLALSAVFGIVAGLSASAQWSNWVLFTHGGSFGTKDGLHHLDVGFYVFKLPFLSFVVDWAFAAMVVVTISSMLFHYLNGAVHVPGVGGVFSDRVKLHLSVLLFVSAVVKAGTYWLDRYRLTTSDQGIHRGAFYTDVNATLPSLTLLTLVALTVGVLFLVGARRRGWGLPLTGAGVWVVVALVAGVMVPALTQKFRVEPRQSSYEAPFLQRNLSATQRAFGLNKVKRESFNYEPDPTPEAVAAGSDSLINARVLDPGLLAGTFSTLKKTADYFRIRTVDVDRYPIDGVQRPVLIGVRELDTARVPAKTWEALHLRFTHGYGVALAPANTANADGEPDFLIGEASRNVSAELEGVTLEHPQVYFGESDSTSGDEDYAIVGTGVAEKGAEDDANYEGKGGVAAGGFLRRLAFSLRFGDFEPIFSDYLRDESRVLYVRDVRTRVSKLVPFLKWDSNPYPILVNGRVKFVVDGYTTSDSYPYAESAQTDDLDRFAALRASPFNYVRNSAKAVVDGYDGTVVVYRTDSLYGEADPIIDAYSEAFPGLFSSIESMPSDVERHLRYPEELFTVQSSMWATYHVTRPTELYSSDDRWNIAQRPPATIKSTTASAGTVTTSPASAVGVGRVDPQYALMSVPGEPGQQFVLSVPFAPFAAGGAENPKQMSALLVAGSDPDTYGRLTTFVMTHPGDDGGRVQRNKDVDGPLAVYERLVSDTQSGLSAQLTLLNNADGGSNAELGATVITPVGNSLVYSRSLFVSGDSSTAARQLRFVIAATGERLVVAPTWDEALAELFPGTAMSEGAAGEPKQASASQLVLDATRLLDEADKALSAGGKNPLAEYETKVAEARKRLADAVAVLNGSAPAAAPAAATP